MSQLWFATCAPGLEDVLLTEVRELGGRKAKIEPGGVEFDASNKALYALLYRLRTANRLYLRVDEFRARDLPEIYNKTRRIEWERLLGPEHEVGITAYSRESRETHTDKIEEAVGFALKERFSEDLGAEPPKVDPDGAQRLMARVVENRCTLNLDAAGELLFRRGWRARQGEAPLRETYAAAMLRALEWNPAEPLVDPMCGAGTIPVEAATIAASRHPGVGRDFAIQSWRNFREETWAEVNAPELAADGAAIIAADADPSMTEMAAINAEQAGVAARVETTTTDVSNLERPDVTPGLILTNAPYGVRLEEDAMGSIRALCERFDAAFSGWRMGILVHRDVTLPLQRKRTQVVLDFRNGGIPVRLWGVDLD